MPYINPELAKECRHPVKPVLGKDWDKAVALYMGQQAKVIDKCIAIIRPAVR
jgi:hypothetical protein